MPQAQTKVHKAVLNLLGESMNVTPELPVSDLAEFADDELFAISRHAKAAATFDIHSNAERLHWFSLHLLAMNEAARRLTEMIGEISTSTTPTGD